MCRLKQYVVGVRSQAAALLYNVYAQSCLENIMVWFVVHAKLFLPPRTISSSVNNINKVLKTTYYTIVHQPDSRQSCECRRTVNLKG